MARPPLSAEQRADQERRQQRQILRGMAACVAEAGYGAVTIADIVRAARVSKSTFYGHFAGKLDCYLALYSASTNNVLAAMEAADAQAAARRLPWRDHIRHVNRAYLASLAEGGALTRSLIVEAQAVGPDGLAMRRDVLDRFARLLRRITDDLCRAHPEVNPLPLDLALAVVGGTNELVMREVEAGRTAQLPALGEPTSAVWCAALTLSLAPALSQ